MEKEKENKKFWVLLSQKESEFPDIIDACWEAVRWAKEEGEMAATVAIEDPNNPHIAYTVWRCYQDTDASWLYENRVNDAPESIKEYL